MDGQHTGRLRGRAGHARVWSLPRPLLRFRARFERQVWETVVGHNLSRRQGAERGRLCLPPCCSYHARVSSNNSTHRHEEKARPGGACALATSSPPCARQQQASPGPAPKAAGVDVAAGLQPAAGVTHQCCINSVALRFASSACCPCDQHRNTAVRLWVGPLCARRSSNNRCGAADLTAIASNNLSISSQICSLSCYCRHTPDIDRPPSCCCWLTGPGLVSPMPFCTLAHTH